MSTSNQPIYSGLNGGSNGKAAKDGRLYVRVRDEASGELVTMHPKLWAALTKVIGNTRISGQLRIGIQAGNVTQVFADNIDLDLIS